MFQKVHLVSRRALLAEDLPFPVNPLPAENPVQVFVADGGEDGAADILADQVQHGFFDGPGFTLDRQKQVVDIRGNVCLEFLRHADEILGYPFGLVNGKVLFFLNFPVDQVFPEPGDPFQPGKELISAFLDDLRRQQRAGFSRTQPGPSFPDNGIVVF